MSSAPVAISPSSEPAVAPATEAPRQLDVVAAVGAAVRLPCPAQAFPPPMRTWYKDGSPIATMNEGVWEVGGDLVMSSARLVDAGEYRCVVNNSVGSITISTRLSVTTPLTLVMEPMRLTLTTGRPLQLLCRVTGSPLDRITWYKNARPIRYVTGSPLDRITAIRYVTGSPLDRITWYKDARAIRCATNELFPATDCLPYTDSRFTICQRL
ncbi:brother of CDO-like [Hyalella azteca]|uniref:Brother of CDO-like n=1 Tax=Hyalella azteca TaxID=294128 RepID=A0A979FUE8_HYAAZ|nr:brother of CDO-like [Hyalella azteca]